AVYDYPGEARAVAFAPRGQTLAAAGGEGFLGLLEASAGHNDLRLRRLYRDSGGSLRMLAFLRQGQALVTATQDGSLKRWEVDALTGVRSLPLPGLLPVLSADGRQTVTAGAGGQLHLRDTFTGAS